MKQHTFRRDQKSHALLNTDQEGLRAYRRRRRNSRLAKTEINTLREQVELLAHMVRELQLQKET